MNRKLKKKVLSDRDQAKGVDLGGKRKKPIGMTSQLVLY
jgi:hypothetical protein